MLVSKLFVALALAGFTLSAPAPAPDPAPAPGWKWWRPPRPLPKPKPTPTPTPKPTTTPKPTITSKPTTTPKPTATPTLTTTPTPTTTPKPTTTPTPPTTPTPTTTPKPTSTPTPTPTPTTPVPTPTPTVLAQVYSKCTQPNTVALSFDDGPYDFTEDLVNTLDAAGAKGTFFYNGNNWRCIYNMADKVQYAYSHGHQIASHTWSHANLPTLTKDKIKWEFQATDEAIERIIGKAPAFVRPPFGAYNNDVLAVAGELGETVALWDFDAHDGDSLPAEQQKAAYDALIAGKPVNVLSLQHDTSTSTVHDVVPYIVQKFKAAGYNMVTVAQCLGMQPYLSKSVLTNPVSQAHC